MANAVSPGDRTYHLRAEGLCPEHDGSGAGFAREPHAVLVGADDCFGGGPTAVLGEAQVPGVAGLDMGITWNESGGRFLLSQLLHCEAVILLGDTPQWGHDGDVCQFLAGTTGIAIDGFRLALRQPDGSSGPGVFRRLFGST